ncbi:hypothetical protein M0R45_028260 [Rubus argutus]|uniref:Uncharacterized protein n=1 Tax=Rubus argutus TaxID=59490 RepID=A0AAW1W772_RUBAR
MYKNEAEESGHLGRVHESLQAQASSILLFSFHSAVEGLRGTLRLYLKLTPSPIQRAADHPDDNRSSRGAVVSQQGVDEEEVRDVIQGQGIA